MKTNKEGEIEIYDIEFYSFEIHLVTAVPTFESSPVLSHHYRHQTYGPFVRQANFSLCQAKFFKCQDKIS